MARSSAAWILVPLLLAIILIFLMILPFALIFILITIFFLIFFRDPERRIGYGIVAPCDGIVSNIDKRPDTLRVSIIMGVHNVHVNRAPFEGIATSLKHIKGKHVPAFNKDSEANERVEIIIKTSFGKARLVLIAGAFARRIVPYIRKGQKLKKGQRIGIIRFGSRVDLYLPRNRTKVLARVGVKVKAGESCLAVVLKDEVR
ncbi:MAG: phosphatidylserine decarboxylase [Thermoplasmata archaeon]|nr:MAG: phosphatidylserine decarboxylase [Thermoplasmata archaeon]